MEPQNTPSPLDSGHNNSPPVTPAPPVIQPPAMHMGMPASAQPDTAVNNFGAPAATGMPSKPKNKGLLIGLVVGLVVLVLAGGAAAAYFGYVVPNKPQNVLNAALVSSFSSDKVTSEHFDGKVSVKDKASGSTFSGTFSGGATTGGAFSINASIDAVVTKVTVDVRSTDGSTYYVRMGGLEGLPELLSTMEDPMAKMYAPMVAGLNNQWIEINESVLSQFGASAPNFKMSEADRTKLGEIYTDHQFLTVSQKLADEKINGMDSYHFKVTVDKDEFKGFVKAIKDAKVAGITITQNELDEFNKSLNEVDFTKYPVDIWVAKDLKMVDQVVFSLSDSEATVNVRFSVVDFNKPVDVQKPVGAKSLLEVMSELVTGGSSQDLLQDLQTNGISL